MVTRFGGLRTRSAEWYFVDMNHEPFTSISSRSGRECELDSNDRTRQHHGMRSIINNPDRKRADRSEAGVNAVKKPSIIERAFEIAREGQCRRISEVAEQLCREGFEDVHAHLNGFRTRQQLTQALRFLDL